MTLSEQARWIRECSRLWLAGSVVDLIELRAALLARYPSSYAAKALASAIAHRVGTLTEKN